MVLDTSCGPGNVRSGRQTSARTLNSARTTNSCRNINSAQRASPASAKCLDGEKQTLGAFKKEFDELASEVRLWGHNYAEISPLVFSLKERLDQSLGPQVEVPDIPHLGLSASLHVKHEIENVQESLERQEEWNKLLKHQYTQLGQILQEQAVRHGDVFAAMAAEVAKWSEQQTSNTESIKASRELTNMMETRITQLEQACSDHRFTDEQVACVLRSIQAQQQQLTQLLQEHQTQLSVLVPAKSVCHNSNTMAVRDEHTSSTDSLKKEAPSRQSTRHKNTESQCQSLEFLLRELREERVSVSASLNYVRQEKAHMLAILHIFNENKALVMKEIGEFRQEMLHEFKTHGLTVTQSPDSLGNHIRSLDSPRQSAPDSFSLCYDSEASLEDTDIFIEGQCQHEYIA